MRRTESLPYPESAREIDATGRSSADHDRMTDRPVEEWRAERGFVGVQSKRGPRPELRNDLYVGGSNGHVSREDVARELVRAKGALDPRLLPGLLAEVLIDRKVNRERTRAILERFGQRSDDLKQLAAEARQAIEAHLVTAFGFLPKYQIRWVGPI